jgi:methyltransferase-like protein
MWPAADSPQTVERIRQLTSRDPAEQPALTADPQTEQYYDFVRVSMSRRSLFCHDNVEIRAVSVKQALEDLHLSYLPSDRRQLTITDERLASVLRLLSEAWPESRPWASIRAEVERTGPLRNRWFDDLFRLFVLDIVQWSVQPNIAVRSLSTRPRTTAFARHQAAASVVVANLRHQSLKLKTADRLVLNLLDGMHTREDIATACSMPLESVEQLLLRLASASLIVA